MARAARLPRPGPGGPPRPHSLWLWIFVSGGIHVLVFSVTFGVLGAGLLAGHGAEWGSFSERHAP